MKKHFTAYLIALMVILALCVTLFTINMNSRNNPDNQQSASVVLTQQPQKVRSYVDLPINGGGGACIRKITQDNGSTTWYAGHWNGSGDCAQLPTAPIVLEIISKNGVIDPAIAKILDTLPLQKTTFPGTKKVIWQIPGTTAATPFK